MPDRLPIRDGQWINREKSIRFRFEGKSYEGFEGDCLSSALWANGVRLLGRSFKYHRARGIYSLAGHDVNTQVEDADATNQRGDLLPIRDGLDVMATNTFGGLTGDRLRAIQWFAGLMPVGFYYKAFYSPRLLFPLYEKMMRRIAGLGKINPDRAAKATPKRYDFCDLLVVGSGPAGLAAAIVAAERGLTVVVVDDMPRPGGSFCYQWPGESTAAEQGKTLLTQVAALEQVDLRVSTQAAGAYADGWIALVDDRCMTKMRATTLLVAAGCYEQPAVFSNNDVPGVMLASAAQRLIHQYAVKPFDRAVVLAANEEGYRAALDLRSAGVDVPVLADLRHEGEHTAWSQRIIEAGIAVHRGHGVGEVVSKRGGLGVQGVRLSRLDERGVMRADQSIHVDCDGLIMSVGWAPTVDLPYQAGARFRYDDRLHQFVAANLPPGVFLAGRANGVYDLSGQVADGRRAALAALAHLGHEVETPEQPLRTRVAHSHPYPIFEDPKKKNFVDLDEDLHLSDFVHAVQEGYDNIELLKRYTTVGMGPSQGKLANMNAIRILAHLTHKTIDQTGSTTARPFHHPVPLSHLAGRRFHPHRLTPMHDWHRRQGARFMEVGAWKRPEYYDRASGTREDTILAEAEHVRQKVGIVDVGTLGKLLVSGADAVTMLERMYTGRFASLEVGRCRYCLACDESGVVIDDGIVARLGHNHFYVTATTSGVESIYREMQRNALLWSLDVVLSNATGHFAAMNIAGPLSRSVLQPLTDIHLGPTDFGYMRVRQGQVAGVQALVMRVGFVGELGYELHVPAGHGRHVWETLMRAGRNDIAPFGIEAQRLLRLEKAHLIVGQDTDALTTPADANLNWAIGKDKPFFVGQRSLMITAKQEPTRRLVGFALPEGYDGPVPAECSLLIADSEIAGRITSIAARSTIGRSIGLAFAKPQLAEPGTALSFRTVTGQMVRANVVPTPFLDPQNERQKG